MSSLLLDFLNDFYHYECWAMAFGLVLLELHELAQGHLRFVAGGLLAPFRGWAF